MEGVEGPKHTAHTCVKLCLYKICHCDIQASISKFFRAEKLIVRINPKRTV